jgi:hypothetical protein
MLDLIVGLFRLGFYLGGFLAVILSVLYGIDFLGMSISFIIAKHNKTFKEFKDEWDRS